MSRPIYIFDLDGTLANGDHRVHHIRGEKKDWRAYFAACELDEPIQPVIDVFKALRKHSTCWIWTGRSNEVREQTVRWLRRHDLIDGFWSSMPGMRDPEALMMRPEGVYTPDTHLKYGWLADLDPPERNRVAGAFEDRDAVVKMWREAGIQCFQVAPGDF